MSIKVLSWDNFKRVSVNAGLKIYFQNVADSKPFSCTVFCIVEGVLIFISLTIGTPDYEDFVNNYQAVAVDLS